MKTLSSQLIRKWMPARTSHFHKGDAGRVYVLAGSRGMVGAGILSSWAALRSGSGLVKLGTVKDQQKVAARRAPLEVTTEALPSTPAGLFSKKTWPVLKKSLNSYKPDVLALGPGFGQSKDLRQLVSRIVSTIPIPLVLDADGLNNLTLKKFKKRKSCWILTPHPGEMAKLMGVSVSHVQKDRAGMVLKAAQKFNAVVVLKGAGSLISDGKTIYKNLTGNSGLASGGTGDVLTGIIASFLGQLKGKNMAQAFKAACLGVYLHGLAADQMVKKKSKKGLIASDLIEALPAVLKRFEKKR